jgi:hypothetical protein
MVEVGSEKVKVSGVKDVLGTRNRGLFHFVLKKNKDEILPKAEQIDKAEPTSTMTSQSSGIEEMVYKCSVRACIFL